MVSGAHRGDGLQPPTCPNTGWAAPCTAAAGPSARPLCPFSPGRPPVRSGVPRGCHLPGPLTGYCCLFLKCHLPDRLLSPSAQGQPLSRGLSTVSSTALTTAGGRGWLSCLLSGQETSTQILVLSLPGWMTPGLAGRGASPQHCGHETCTNWMGTLPRSIPSTRYSHPSPRHGLGWAEVRALLSWDRLMIVGDHVKHQSLCSEDRCRLLSPPNHTPGRA